MFNARNSSIALVSGLCVVANAGITDTVITFDHGLEGFTSTGGFNDILPNGGNDGAYYNSITESFGVEWQTTTNESFLGEHGRPKRGFVAVSRFCRLPLTVTAQR